MHAIKPNAKYRVFNIRVAIPEWLSEAETADAINETLRAVVGEPDEKGQTPYWLADYEFGAQLEEADVFVASADPEEGELFI